jgi:heme-degrading monooxygenase HmoA
MAEYQIAELNIGRLVAPVGDLRVADFVDNLERINQLGHQIPGFVWQLLTEDGDSTAFRIFEDDDNLFINLTVWETIDALFAFTYSSEHVEFFRRRREWFHRLEDYPALVLWWVPAGHQPTLAEAREKLLYLKEHGPTPLAFTFKRRFSVEAMLQARG